MAEVRIDAERELREVAEPRDHPGQVVDRETVDQERPHAHLLEPPCRPAEEVACGRAAVQAVDAANSATAAAEGQTHRKPRLEQERHGLEGRRLTDESERLE